jgi:hypothetical protein
MTVAAFAVVIAVVLLPGIGLARACAPPGQMLLETRVALALGLGYAGAALVATVLTAAHALRPLSFAAGIGLLAATAWAARRPRFARRAPPPSGERLPAADPLLTGGSLAIVAAFTVAHLTVSPAENFDSVSSFRYWADGLEIADAGRIPAHTVQWGVEQVPTVSKVALNAFDAGVSLLTGAGPLAPMRALTVLSAVGVAAALLALGRELGMRAGAVVLTGVAVMAPPSLPAPRELSNDLDVFRAESFGRLAACCGLLLALRCVRGRAGRPVMAAAAATFAVAALTHLVPALIALAALAALALLDRSPTPSRSRKVGRAAAIAAAAAAIWAGALIAAGGSLGLQRVTGGAAYPAGLAGIDPTASFALQRRVALRPARTFTIAPSTLADRYLASIAGRQGTSAPRYALVLVGLVVIASAVVVLAGTREQRVPVILGWCLAAGSLAAALAFSSRYRTLVPADFGPRRLFDYAALSCALVAGSTTDVVIDHLRGPRLRRGAVAVVFALVLAAALDRGEWRSGGPADAADRALPALGRSLPCDARVLTDVRSAGILEAYTGRVSVVEGGAPYLRPADMPAALDALTGAKRFFADPAGGEPFLRAHRIGFVVLFRPGLVEGGRLRSPGSPVAAAGLGPVSSPDPAVRVITLGPAPGSGPYPTRCASRD